MSKQCTNFTTHQKYENFNINKDKSLKIDTQYMCTLIQNEFGNFDKYYALIETLTIKSNVCAISEK